MVWREYPELSAFDEGAKKAEEFIPRLVEEYEERGFQSSQDAVQHYGELAYDFLQKYGSTDPEHGELLRGYLSRFD